MNISVRLRFFASMLVFVSPLLNAHNAEYKPEAIEAIVQMQKPVTIQNMSNEQNTMKHGNQWVPKTYEIKGGYSIEEVNGQLVLSLDADFSTSSGPDLKLYITKVKLEDIGNRDSVDLDGVYIAELSSHKGAQTYTLPEGIVLGEYHSVVVHCKKYSVVWGGFVL